MGAFQIIQSDQKDIGAQVGQAIAGGTSAYFDSLHKGEMRNVEKQKVSEAMRSARASESLSALGVASNVAMENMRDKRARDTTNATLRQQESENAKTRAQAAQLQKEEWEARERIAVANQAAEIRAARIKAAAESMFDAQDLNSLSQNNERIRGRMFDDIDAGKTSVPPVDANGNFIDGKPIKLTTQYPFQRYKEAMFPTEVAFENQLYDNAFRSSPEYFEDSAIELTAKIKSGEVTSTGLTNARTWAEQNKRVLLQLEGGKERYQNLIQEIDRQAKVLATRQVEEQESAKKEEQARTEYPGSEYTGMGASGFLQQKSGVYDLGLLKDIYTGIARGE